MRGQMVVDNVRLDLSKVTIPIFNLATREDHIAPALSVYEGSSAFGGAVRFVVSGSGHIAGVVNPPARGKYQFWTGPQPRDGLSFDAWWQETSETKGSWWPDWEGWLREQSGEERVPAREPGGDRLAPIEDAPGGYVRD